MRDRKEILASLQSEQSTGRFRPTEKTARTLFGIDFMFVLLFVTLAFYFFWPVMFQTPQPYAPESVIQDTFTLFLKARDRCEQHIEERPSGDIPFADLLHFPELSEGKDPAMIPKLLVWNETGNVSYGKEEWPKEWELIRPPWFGRNEGSFIQRKEKTASLILYGRLPKTGLYLVIAAPFDPQFRLPTASQDSASTKK